MKRYVLARMATLLGAMLALAALPFVFAMHAERYYHAHLDALVADSGWRIVESEFKRGWLRSNAHTVIARADRTPLRIRIDHRVHHGPYPLARVARWQDLLSPLSAEVHSTVRMAAADTAVIEAVTVIGIDGTLNTELRGNEGQMALPPPWGAVIWRGLRGERQANAQGHQAATHMSVDSLSWQLPGREFEIEKVSASLESVRPDRYWTDFDMRVQAEQVTRRGPGPKLAVTLVDIEMDSSLGSDTNGRFRVQGAFEGGQAGGTTLESGAISATLQGIDSNAIAEAHQRRLTRQRQAGIDSGSLTPVFDAATLLDAAGASDAHLRILARVDLPLTAALVTTRITADGQSDDGTSRLGAVGNLTLPAELLSIFASYSIEDELDRLQARGLLPTLTEQQRSRAVADAVALRISQWTQSELLRWEQGAFHASITIADGHLRLNERIAFALPRVQ